jgi:hypothetical protein
MPVTKENSVERKLLYIPGSKEEIEVTGRIGDARLR